MAIRSGKSFEEIRHAVDLFAETRRNEVEQQAQKSIQYIEQATQWLSVQSKLSQEKFHSLPTSEYKQWLDESYSVYRRRFPAHRQVNPEMTGAAMQLHRYRHEFVSHKCYEILQKFPLAYSLAYPEHLHHLSERNDTQFGKIHVFAEEDFSAKALKRVKGQTLAGKRASAFRSLVKVAPGSEYWGEPICLDDIVAAEKIIGVRSPKIGEQAPLATNLVEKIRKIHTEASLPGVDLST